MKDGAGFTTGELTFHALVSNHTASLRPIGVPVHPKRSGIRYLALALMMVFVLVGSAHGFLHHHHTNQTEEQDCAFCNFHNNTKLSDVSITLPDLTPVFLLLFTFAVFQAFFKPLAFAVHSGRAPPAVPASI